MVLNNINGRFDQKLLRHFQYIMMNDVLPAVHITTVLYLKFDHQFRGTILLF